MTERKLASVQIVQTVEPIENADAIERVRVLGWWLVAKKGEFQPGDKVVYCEIDSLLPERAEFEFLRKGCYRPATMSGETVLLRAGFRIKTVRLRGQVSQGICFPLSILSAGASREVGADVATDLDILKYEPPLPLNLSGRIRGPFPAFISKTDELRVQAFPGLLERHRGKVFCITEKLDGTSFTAFHRDGQFGVCSRNLWLDETDVSNQVVRMGNELRLPEKLAQLRESLGFNLAIQGEVIGPGVQGNKYGLKAIELRIFNVFNIDTFQPVGHARTQEILDLAGLKPVPSLESLTLGAETVDDLVRMSAGTSLLNHAVQREGIVLRTPEYEYDAELGGRLSFKVINPQFLLKYGE